MDKGHGRLELRRLQASTYLNGYCEFPYSAQVFKLTRERLEITTNKFERETVFGITSLTPDRADAERLLRLNRGQWSIENRSHWIRDWNYDEDRGQIRKGNGPQMMACLRNMAIGLLRLAKRNDIARSHREYAAKTHLVFKLLRI